MFYFDLEILSNSTQKLNKIHRKALNSLQSCFTRFELVHLIKRIKYKIGNTRLSDDLTAEVSIIILKIIIIM